MEVDPDELLATVRGIVDSCIRDDSGPCATALSAIEDLGNNVVRCANDFIVGFNGGPELAQAASERATIDCYPLGALVGTTARSTLTNASRCANDFIRGVGEFDTVGAAASDSTVDCYALGALINDAVKDGAMCISQFNRGLMGGADLGGGPVNCYAVGFLIHNAIEKGFEALSDCINGVTELCRAIVGLVNDLAAELQRCVDAGVNCTYLVPVLDALRTVSERVQACVDMSDDTCAAVEAAVDALVATVESCAAGTEPQCAALLAQVNSAVVAAQACVVALSQATGATSPTEDDSLGCAATAATALALLNRSNPPIGVRTIAGDGQFYNTATGEVFFPRGTNFHSVESANRPPDTTSLFRTDHDDDMFGQSFSEPVLEQKLIFLKDHGYNTVRVFIAAQGVVNRSPVAMPGVQLPGPVPTNGLDDAYMARVARFIKLAEKHGIYVVVCNMYIPVTDPKAEVGGGPYEPPSDPRYSRTNSFYFSTAMIDMQKKYAQDFTKALIYHRTPLSQILGYSLQQEQKYVTTLKPFTTLGPVTTATGIYNFGDPGSRNLAMDDGLRYWMTEVRKALREVVPDALVTAGFWSPCGDHEGLVSRPSALLDTAKGSTADFVDIHMYPHYQHTEKDPITDVSRVVCGTLHEQAARIGSNDWAKPRMMGEFGQSAPRIAGGRELPNQMPTALQAANRLIKWQAESCHPSGGRFDGWLQWIYDTTMYDIADEVYAFEDPRDPNHYVARGLSPEFRDHPCADTPIL